MTTRALDLAGLTRLFHALSDETRLAVLGLLRGGERCVCDLTELLDTGQSRLSFHLRTLREAGLVTDRREGRWVYYSLAPGAMAQAHEALAALENAARTEAGLHRRGPCC